MSNSKKKLLTASILLTFIFYSLANGYRYFHTIFAGDSLYMIYQNDAGWEISLGRFVQPFLVALRGAVTTPLLISVLSVLWVSLSVYFVADFLEIKKMVSVAFIAAIMSCNATILSLNATFLPYMDFYLLALFLSVLGVWLIKKERLIFLVSGSLCLSISLGIYQSYICVSIALVMIHFLCKIPDLPTFKAAFQKAGRYLFSFLTAAIVYFTVWKLFQVTFDIWTSDSYNGMASIGDFSETGIGSILGLTYQYVLDYFMYPDTFITNTFHGIPMSYFWQYVIRICNITVVLVIIFTLIQANRNRKTNLWQKMIQMLIVLLFPLGINFVCVISQGMEHPLMIYAFYFVYVLAIKLAEDHFSACNNTQNIKKAGMPWKIALVSLAVIFWSNMVFSNQVYLKRELQERAAQSILTRIIYRIESVEEYIPGVTPVALSGNFESSPCIAEAAPFDEIRMYSMGKTCLNYPAANNSFLTYILNMNVNLTDVDSTDERILQMPVYPAEDSVAFVDGVLVIKISE